MASDKGNGLDRRHVLSTLATAAVGSVAGCTDVLRPPSGATEPDTPLTGTTTEGAPSDETSTGRDYHQVYQQAVDSVAQIQTEGGRGTSWVIDSTGNLVTNAHVVGPARRVTVLYRDGVFRDGRVLGTDVYSDLAVVAVRDPPAYADPLSLADEIPRVGTPVVVLGNPFGLESTLSAGIVSGVNRSLPSPTGFSIPGAIQTDAAVNPGNSGGPMLDLDGNVLAVINSGGGENIAFGIPNPLLRRVVPALIETGGYEHPYMGVRLQEISPAVARERGRTSTDGVLVIETVSGAPAADALREDDIIVALDDNPIRTTDDLSRYLAFETSPDDRLRVTVIRGSDRDTVSFSLGARPDP